MGKENIICGKRVIREVINSEVSIDVLYVSKKINRDSITDIILWAKKNSVDIKFVYENDIHNICESRVSQGIAAKISNYRYYKFGELLNELEKEEFPCVLILDGIQDPRNLGAILRSAECIGIKNIILPQKKSVSVTDTVWKTSMGSLAHLNICRINNLQNVILNLKQKSFKIVATDVNSKMNIGDEKYNFPLAIIVGNEHEGISDKLLSQCDIKVKIPMYGNIKSFNVSVAAGIVMYEIKNKQRRYRV